MKDMSDYYNVINTAAEEAEKRGLARGLEQGREEAKLEAAKKFKELGVDIETIVQATGLSVDVIEGL